MELREFAFRIVSARSLEQKLAHPTAPLTDERPGQPLLWRHPARPDGLSISSARQARVPPISRMGRREHRIRILHAFANHELQAAELYAWALLAFADANPELRRDLLDVLLDEQRHTRMYISRLKAHGCTLGAYPVSGYFWTKSRDWTTPLRFVCAMSLTFENANLDYTTEYSEAANAVDDEKTAALIEQVHADEVRHVAFGWKWLQRLKSPSISDWDAYCSNVTWPVRPGLSRGSTFHESGRVAAGLSPEFIAKLRQTPPGKGPGAETTSGERDETLP